MDFEDSLGDIRLEGINIIPNDEPQFKTGLSGVGVPVFSHEEPPETQDDCLSSDGSADEDDDDDDEEPHPLETVTPELLSHVNLLGVLAENVLLSQFCIEDKITTEFERVLFERNKRLRKNVKDMVEQENDEEPPSYDAEHIRKFQRVVTAPYFKTGVSELRQVAPPFQDEGKEAFPKTAEWRPKELESLEFCVRKSYFHKQMFFMNGRFHQMLLDVGFTNSELRDIEVHQRGFDAQIWQHIHKEIRSRNKNFEEKANLLLDSFIDKEKDIFDRIIKLHENDEDKTLKPLNSWRIPRLETLSQGGVAAHINIKDLIDLQQKELKSIYKQLFKNEIVLNEKEIDWQMVCKEMAKFTSRKLTPEHCQITYKFCLSKEFNREPFTSKEILHLKRLTKAYKNKHINWDDVTKSLGTNRTKLQVFHLYRDISYQKSGEKYMETLQGRKLAVKLVAKHKGNLIKVVLDLEKVYGQTSLEKFTTNWRQINPSFARGYFYPEEDAILLATLQMLGSPHNSRTDVFLDVQHYLPWRYCNVWRQRAQALFRPRNSLWSIEEDYLLLELVERHGIQWGGFQNTFTSKTDKLCASRYKLLQKKLERMTLEQYHVIYSRRNKSIVPVTSRVQNISRLLESILLEKHQNLRQRSEEVQDPLQDYILPEPPYVYNPAEFNWNPPRSGEPMMKILKSFDTDVLISTFSTLVNFIKSVQAKHDLEPSQSNENRFHYNRRKFDINDPISLASALQLRGVALKPKEENFWSTLTTFEKSIYSLYTIFESCWPIKKGSTRRTIPSAIELALIPSLHRIIIPPKEALRPEKPLRALLPNNGEEQYELVYDVQSNDGGFELPLTSRLVEAQDKLYKRVTGTTNWGPRRKTKIKERKKEATTSRWAEKRRIQKMKVPVKPMIEPKSVVVEVEWQYRGGMTGGPAMLQVLHDHNYMRNYKELKITTEMDIKEVTHSTHKRARVIYGCDMPVYAVKPPEVRPPENNQVETINEGRTRRNIQKPTRLSDFNTSISVRGPYKKRKAREMEQSTGMEMVIQEEPETKILGLELD